MNGRDSSLTAKTFYAFHQAHTNRSPTTSNYLLLQRWKDAQTKRLNTSPKPIFVILALLVVGRRDLSLRSLWSSAGGAARTTGRFPRGTPRAPRRGWVPFGHRTIHNPQSCKLQLCRESRVEDEDQLPRLKMIRAPNEILVHSHTSRIMSNDCSESFLFSWFENQDLAAVSHCACRGHEQPFPAVGG